MKNGFVSPPDLKLEARSVMEDSRSSLFFSPSLSPSSTFFLSPVTL